MATNRTDSLIGTGGDYTTPQSWEDDIGVGLGTSANLVTDDYDHYGWLTAEQHAFLTISGHITDASHRIHLAADSNGATCPASQHGGTKTDAALMDDSSRSMAYNSSYAALLNSATGYVSALTVQDNYVEISRLQIKAVPGNAAALDATGRAGVTLRRCLLEHRGGSWNTWFRYATGGLIESSLLVGLASNQFQGMEGVAFRHCTIVRSSTAALSATATQVDAVYGRPSTQNCALFAGGNGTEWFQTQGANAWSLLDNNATDFSDLSAETGEGSNNVYNLSQTAQFVAVNNTDWSLKEGNDLATGGADLTATVLSDFWGDTFNIGDIGCEASAAAAAYPTLSAVEAAAYSASSITPRCDIAYP